MTKTVLITGCSSGIGRATADLFARRHWNVAATARNPDAIAAGPNIRALRLDVTDGDSVRMAIAEALTVFGAIDVLVNNAGFGVFGPLEGMTAEQWEGQFRTNVLGLVSVTREVLPGMRERGTGVIVNVSSIAGRTAAPFLTGYHATKFAVEGLSESLRYELSLHGIRVKVIEPGHFRTGFVSPSREAPHPAYARAFENFMGYVRKEDAAAPGPEAVAEVIYRAASDRSNKLRYPVGGGMILTLAALLPDALWRSLNAAGMTRPPR